MLGGIGGRRKRGRQRMRWLDGITDLMDMGLGLFGNCYWEAPIPPPAASWVSAVTPRVKKLEGW